MYALFEDGNRISDWLSLSDIVLRYGDVKELEKAGFRVVRKGQ